MHEGVFIKTVYCANRNEGNLISEFYIKYIYQTHTWNKLTHSWITDKGTKNMEKINDDI